MWRPRSVLNGLMLVLSASGLAFAQPAKDDTGEESSHPRTEPWRDPERREASPEPPDMRSPSGPWPGGVAPYVQPAPPPSHAPAADGCGPSQPRQPSRDTC
jgi:hypothetical protein